MNLNYLAVAVAALVHFALGMIWYSPMLFAKKRMELAGVSEMKPKPQHFVVSILISLTISYVLAQFIYLTGANTIALGACIGLWAWIGFVVTTQIGPVLWENKPVGLFLMGAGINFISFAAVWR